jgi:hypothetical protein
VVLRELPYVHRLDLVPQFARPAVVRWARRRAQLLEQRLVGHWELSSMALYSSPAPERTGVEMPIRTVMSIEY